MSAASDHQRLERFLAAWTGHARWADSRNLLKSMDLPAANSCRLGSKTKSKETGHE